VVLGGCRSFLLLVTTETSAETCITCFYLFADEQAEQGSSYPRLSVFAPKMISNAVLLIKCCDFSFI